MSYSNHTQNYNLGLFADGDTIQYQDWNENAEKIDVALKSNATGVSGLQEFQAEITETVETVSIEQSALNTKVGALETKVNTNTSDIAKVQSAEAENSIDIENLQEKVQMNTDDINALEGGTNYQQLVQKTNTLETKVNANTADITKLSNGYIKEKDHFHPNDTFQYASEGSNQLSISGQLDAVPHALHHVSLVLEYTYTTEGVPIDENTSAYYDTDGNHLYSSLSVATVIPNDGVKHFYYVISGMIVLNTTSNSNNLKIYVNTYNANQRYASFEICVTRFGIGTINQ